MKPTDRLLTGRALSDVEVDAWRVTRGGAFVLALGAVAGSMLATLGGVEGTTRRLLLLALIGLPLVTFVFATLEFDVRLRLSGALDPVPGVVEAWGLVVVAAAGVVLLYGPTAGLGAGYANVSLAVLALFGYVLGPPWLAWRLLEGVEAADTAVVTVLLSVFAVLFGGALVVASYAQTPADTRLLAGLGVAGTVAVALWAAS